MTAFDNGFLISTDYELLQNNKFATIKSVYTMHRNDFLVKSNEHTLKKQYTHAYPDTLYYLLVDGEFYGAVAGKFRYTPEVEDVILDISAKEAIERKDEILKAIHILCGENNPIKRYKGEGIY